MTHRSDKPRKFYTVIVVQDEDGSYVACIKEVKGCLTQSKNVKQLEERIRESLSLFVENADSAELRWEFEK